jgi:NADPH:quinone reductase-like Zn-dependent oxidoreductase
MRAVVIDRYGSPDALELREVARPEPGAGEVLVRVLAASVNDWDWAMMRGTPLAGRLVYGLRKPKVRILGCDIAGRVEAVGEGVQRLAAGDRVYGDLSPAGFGAFAQYACAPADDLALMPGGMTFQQAAAIPQAGMLAVQGLIDAGAIQAGLEVLLNGAGGGVGTLALQIAKLHEAEVTVVDRGSKLDALLALGAGHAIDYLAEDFTTAGRAYDLILDVKTNRSPLAYARALNHGGTYVTVGGDMGRLLQVAVWGPVFSRLAHKHLRVVGLKANKDLDYMNKLFDAGHLVPVLDRHYRLDQVPEALRYFGTGEHTGKVIIRMDDHHTGPTDP